MIWNKCYPENFNEIMDALNYGNYINLAPYETYELTDVLIIPENKTLCGNGAKLIVKSNMPGIKLNPESKINNLSILPGCHTDYGAVEIISGGHNLLSDVYAGRNGSETYKFKYGFYLDSIQSSVLRDCRIQDCALDSGIYSKTYCNAVTFDRPRIRVSNAIGIKIENPSAVYINQPTAQGCGTGIDVKNLPGIGYGSIKIIQPYHEANVVDIKATDLWNMTIDGGYYNANSQKSMELLNCRSLLLLNTYPSSVVDLTNTRRSNIIGGYIFMSKLIMPNNETINFIGVVDADTGNIITKIHGEFVCP